MDLAKPSIRTNYLDILQERLKHNVFQELLQRVKFFTEEPENIKIRNLNALKDPRVRTDSRIYSDGEFPAYYDARFPSYSVNQYEGFFVCEGVSPDDKSSVARFLKNTCFNQNCAIKNILVIGQPAEGKAKFYDYFTKEDTYGNYKITPLDQGMISPGINSVKLKITDSTNSSAAECKEISLYQLINMPDHQTATLNPQDLDELYKILSTIKPADLVAHCAAGLGRSPTILFSFILFKKFMQIFTKSNKHIVAEIINELTAFRQIRPAAIQNFYQLQQAIQLVFSYKAIQWGQYSEQQKQDMNSIPTICIVGAFDTKGDDYTFLRNEIINAGLNAYTINTGIFEPKSNFPIDVDAKELLCTTGFSIESIRAKKDRPKAIDAMKKSFMANILKIYKQNDFQGIIGLGGTNGTDIITSGMRLLPREIKKICVSTVTQHENWTYTKDSGIIMIDPFTDVGGLNSISEDIYAKSVQMLCGMLEPMFKNSIPSPRTPSKKIAISMFGNTTPCVDKCAEALTAMKYECLKFHMVGTGGQKMESLVNEGKIDAVLDITTNEIANRWGGLFDAGEDRLSPPGRKGIPHLIIPGCLDMINLGPYEQAKKQFPDRQLHRCNNDVTVMRTTVQENIEMGRIIAAKANVANGPIAILLPLKGLSMFEETLIGWHDQYANEALFASLKSNLQCGIPVIEVDAYINSDIFANKAIEIMQQLINEKLVNSATNILSASSTSSSTGKGCTKGALIIRSSQVAAERGASKSLNEESLSAMESGEVALSNEKKPRPRPRSSSR